MSSDTPTPPRGIRPPRFHDDTTLDDLKCPGCRMLYGHRAACPELAAIRRTVELRAHAARHWVRAVTVKAAEKTQRGPMVVWFQFFR